MANHKSALKRHRQSIKARNRNRMTKTRIKHSVKAVRLAIENNDKDKAQQALQQATSVLDRAASKNVVHWRTAARKISRLSKAVSALG
ncbi:30S ribosomal protein S20 [Desulfoplanes formicivorans]|uniref:Small ribosomal subunit protein bS20 n=1 Tax=Desulfoplanes formicivorans TaxID=1592317 RepID=A0A194AJE4_9BACT|nr:30S ribosomal protein S20 [Desulfoplanes formicivorans]GAU09443.1 30S ribosomal protein S20 [Desulfoplanes formicivorans]